MQNKTAVMLIFTILYGGQAFAACTTTPLTGAEINTAFSGKTLSFNCITGCESWMDSTPVDWHEIHQAGGSLTEVGTGSGGLQPSQVVGTWNISGNHIRYAYTGDRSYNYRVYQISGTLGDPGSSYEFCTNSGTHKATGTID